MPLQTCAPRPSTRVVRKRSSGDGPDSQWVLQRRGWLAVVPEKGACECDLSSGRQCVAHRVVWGVSTLKAHDACGLASCTQLHKLTQAAEHVHTSQDNPTTVEMSTHDEEGDGSKVSQQHSTHRCRTARHGDGEGHAIRSRSSGNGHARGSVERK